MFSHRIKFLVSLFVYQIDRISVLFGKSSGKCVVINYHSVSEKSLPGFARQLDLLSKWTIPIHLHRGLLLEKGRSYVAVTVDDAFRSFIENGMPELQKRSIPVTLFPPTGFLGRNSSWADYGGENKVGEEVASIDALKHLAKSELVNFGSHCVTHPDLTTLPDDHLRRELNESKASLETLTGRSIVAVSFPYGSYGPRELRFAAEAGYEMCFDSTPQSIFSAFRDGLIGRVDVQPTDSDLEFKLKILGAYRWIRWISNWKRKLYRYYRGLFPSLSEF